MSNKITNQFIYHICTTSSWTVQVDNKYYCHESLAVEGFVHCCVEAQVEGVLKRYFENVNDLLLLKIDTSKLNEKLIYEKAPIGEYFPHIYGPIEKGVISEISALR